MLVFVSEDLLKVIHKPQNGVSGVTGLKLKQKIKQTGLVALPLPWGTVMQDWGLDYQCRAHLAEHLGECYGATPLVWIKPIT
jgi:hypothetical protein